METFRWGSDLEIPAALDLRLLGWVLAADDDAGERVTIVPAENLDAGVAKIPGRYSQVLRLTIVSGVNSTDRRAEFLAMGFGEAVGDRVTLQEFEVRARRLALFHDWLPRRRTIGGLELDLLTRDGTFRGQPIGLKPREFELLWRLADSPDEAVSRQSLVHDVLGLSFEPLSNSIAVHVSRLRGKLGAAGLKDLVQTESGGYRLCVPPAPWATGLRSSPRADLRIG